VEHAPTTLDIKKFEKNMKIPKSPHNPTITQKIHMKVKTKYPKMLSLCFVSFKVKDIIALYIKI
jgi:hypothetical protein